ncbi:MAG: SDR family oxidoreductase [Myxococcales bacterium]|nr:SDR family oxidoreductase [Myxococcales bacterium]
MTTPLRALVSGAGQRLGQAIALALGQRGAHVVVHYHRSRTGAEETAAAIHARGGRADLLQADLSDARAARELVDRAVEVLGGLDLLVPSAANFERIPYDDLDDDALERALGLNLAGPFALAHQASPALRASRGNIVFITCSSATAPYRNYLPYTVSKAALRHLMRTLSLELAPDVRVNAVAPGTVLPPTSYTPAAIDKLARAVPLQRIGSPEDVVRAVLYLHDSPFVTGQELVVDGGRS